MTGEKEPEHFEERLAARLRMLTAFCVVLAIGLVLTIALAVWGFARASSITSAIQAQRASAILRECSDQNLRHASTIHELDAILAAAERRTPARRTQIEASRAPTVLIIDALAPYQNCAALISRDTHPPGVAPAP